MKVLFNQYLRDYNTIRIGGKVRWMFFPVNASQILEAIKFAWLNKAPFFILAGGSNTVFEDVHMNSRQVVINLSEMNKLEVKNLENYNSDLIACHPELDSGSKKLEVSKYKAIQKTFRQSATVTPSDNKSQANLAVPYPLQVTTSNNSFQSKSTKPQFIYIESDPGVPLQKIVDITLANNAGDMVGLNRVPGTIGGAVVGNAGAYGCEIMAFIDKIEYIDLSEIIKQPNWVNIHVLSNNNCKFGYRDSVFKQNKNWLITNIYLKIPIDLDLTAAIGKYNEIAIKRDAVYPKGFASPGSLFKNILFSKLPLEDQKNIPPEWVMYGNKLPVGMLLENLGLQGFTYGKIQMRPTHANIMINIGGATYKDVKETVKILQQKVKERFRIDIEPEVRFVDGDFSKFWR